MGVMGTEEGRGPRCKKVVCQLVVSVFQWVPRDLDGQLTGLIMEEAATNTEEHVICYIFDELFRSREQNEQCVITGEILGRIQWVSMSHTKRNPEL